MTLFQKLATAALASVLLLIFVGATVRVTGSGMGCPDWPTCWGCWVPPVTVDQVNFDLLPIKKFQKEAASVGRDPALITRESLRAEFNPRYVWTEYINRLTSLPVLAFSFATFLAAFWQRETRPIVFWVAFAALLLVLANGMVGALVVFSGLKAVIITTHLALAMGSIFLFTFCAWRGNDEPWSCPMGNSSALNWLRWIVGALTVVVVTEGILGAQVRELTDEMAKSHLNLPRNAWAGELEQSGVFLLHRSFSWAVFFLATTAWWLRKCYGSRPVGPVENTVLFIVFAQMILGLVMAQVHIYAWVQVLHVGLAGILLSQVVLWMFGLSKHRPPTAAT